VLPECLAALAFRAMIHSSWHSVFCSKGHGTRVQGCFIKR
jgi:hypothetical protein